MILNYLFDVYENNADIQVRFNWTPGTSALWDNRYVIIGERGKERLTVTELLFIMRAGIMRGVKIDMGRESLLWQKYRILMRRRR